jgi:hypothetical protein
VSCTIRIGSRIAAARIGEITSDNKGRASSPMPRNPPLLRPRRITPGTAAA